MTSQDIYGNYLRYGAKTMPKTRGIHEIDISQGLITGYRGRETDVPPGFLTHALNVMPRPDGTYAMRPGFRFGPSYNTPSGHTGATHLAGAVVGTFVDGGILTVMIDPTTNDIVVHRPGFTDVTNTAPDGNDYFHWGNAAHYGNESIIPVIQYEDVNGATPTVQFLRVVYTPGAPGTMTAVLTDLTALLSHQAYVYKNSVSGVSRYGRVFAIAFKGRTFIFAGTQISYSAPLQPSVFTVASGGGNIPLDTEAPITGAFLLADVMYIATEAELFAMTYSTDPGRDRNLRVHTKMRIYGAAEYDNVGYLAVPQGLVRIVSNQIVPTFIPSDQNFSGPNLTMLTESEIDDTIHPFETSSLPVPKICGIHKIGDLILLAGIDPVSTAIDSGTDFRYPVFSITTETWVEWDTPITWPGTSMGGIFAPVNALAIDHVPIKTYYLQVFDTHWAGPGNRAQRMEIPFDLSTNMRNVVDGGTAGAPTFVERAPYLDMRFVIDFPTDVVNQIYNLESTVSYRMGIQTGRLIFGSPITWKRLHRFWSKFSFDAGSASAKIDFYSPGDPQVPDFLDLENDMFYTRLVGTASKVNQTPGMIGNDDSGNPSVRFSSLHLFHAWNQNTGADLGSVSPSEWSELGFGRYFFDITEYGPSNAGI